MKRSSPITQTQNRPAAKKRQMSQQNSLYYDVRTSETTCICSVVFFYTGTYISLSCCELFTKKDPSFIELQNIQVSIR